MPSLVSLDRLVATRSSRTSSSVSQKGESLTSLSLLMSRVRALLQCLMDMLRSYNVLFGAGPSIKENLKGDADNGASDKTFSAYFNKTLVHMVKRENFAKSEVPCYGSI